MSSFWQTATLTAPSRVRDVLEISPLAFSVACICLTLSISQYLRSAVRGASDPGVWRQCLEEMVAAFELCGCCYELIIIADNYGVGAYAVALFLLTIWWSKHWGDATACPYTYLEDLLEGRTNYGVVILKTIFGLIGALSVFQYIQLIWGLEMVENHKDRADSKCVADLQVPVLYGALVELAATFVCRVCSRTIGELGPKHGAPLDSFIGTSLVVLGFNYSGGYYNPLLATGLKLGCLGHTFAQFFVVYWLGATLGSVAASYFFRLPAVHSLLVPSAAAAQQKPAEEEIENVWPDHED
ncbi:aquaporin-11 isoform X2 [Neocloeon triangulifer]|uniref:aquaporin-11 isoform X2 n=1 Tax=Neocloeon triangulifer TaxID=2078957 RepID=UPI00286F4728|nr:aquaporin-11 isoform X2 [Neocloeon triangulifer]